MGLISFLQEKMGGKHVPVSGFDSALVEEYAELVGELCYRELAFWSAINMIANAVSKCEFKTFVNKKETQGPEYYLWNVEPNQNQNSSGFIHKWIAHLYRRNECLIVEYGGRLYVADSFVKTPYALYEDIFSNVTIGDFSFTRTFTQSEVLYWQLGERDMKKVVDALYAGYSKLLAYSMKAYQKSRGTKGVYQYGTIPVAGTKEREAFDNIINNQIKTWLNSDNAALPLGSGQEWKELTQKTYSSESTRDIRAMVDDISDFTAKAVGIHPALLRGDVQDVGNALDYTLTFCVDPLTVILQEEINRKRYGLKGMQSGNYLQIDTKTIKHIDWFDIANNVDKLISSGARSINDILKMVDEPTIDEPWANEHFITRNYMPFKEALEQANTLKGGEQK
ncbi:phage portal protein [Clostridium merdae]|uniref:phage portal protein n=1 Tax=Clostridium merdae TaxID=1958780 RepID=UPI000A26BB30|nr:phage portal protein [Clostridium merdae]